MLPATTSASSLSGFRRAASRRRAYAVCGAVVQMRAALCTSSWLNHGAASEAAAASASTAPAAIAETAAQSRAAALGAVAAAGGTRDGRSLARGRERTGEAEQRERGRAQPGELPEPVERAVHDPVAEPGERGPRDGAHERVVSAQRLRGREQRGAEADEREQRADQARLARACAARRCAGSGASRRCGRAARYCCWKLSAPIPTSGWCEEFVERHAVEVVAVAAEAARSAGCRRCCWRRSRP